MNLLKNSGPLAIGALARQTGLAVSAIRYYEEIGLIKPAARRDSGHRFYSEEAREALTLIRHCRDFGFSIEETRELVSLSASEGRDCVEAREIAHVHLKAVRQKLLQLHTLETGLARFVQACTDQCAGGPAPQCAIFTELGSITSKTPTPQPSQSGCCG